MIKVAAVVLAAFVLLGNMGGCDDRAYLIMQKYNIPDIPPQLYNCPVIQKYPAVATLRDSQIAQLLIQLRSNNLTCKQSLEGIRRFLAAAKQTVKSQ